jgi:DNA-binding CsgD family transcriptional regulator
MSSLVPEPESRAPLVLRGAELTALTEHFNYWAFLGVLVFLAPSAAAALVLLPLRKSADPVGWGTPTVWLAAGIVLVVPVAVRFAPALYRRLRRWPPLELVPVAMATALIAYPLRSELWWPACALLMLVATVAPLGRALAYALLVLILNLVAHLIAGDLRETPAISIIGLWIGFIFWTSVASVFTDRFARYLLNLNRVRRAQPRQPPLRVASWTDPEPPPRDAAPVAAPAPRAPTGQLARLTARQLEVVLLLADGLRYRDIAECLSISIRQVQRHVAEAVARAGVSNANELTALAVRDGLAPEP